MNNDRDLWETSLLRELRRETRGMAKQTRELRFLRSCLGPDGQVLSGLLDDISFLESDNQISQREIDGIVLELDHVRGVQVSLDALRERRELAVAREELDQRPWLLDAAAA